MLFRVYVAESLISSAGEGLFSKIAVGPNTVMSFYNGVRITHQEVSGVEVENPLHLLKGFASNTLNVLISPFILVFIRNAKEQTDRLSCKIDWILSYSSLQPARAKLP